LLTLAKYDWLVKKKEKGETFMNFIRNSQKNHVTPKRMTIYLFKVDDDISEELLSSLVEYCKVFFLGLKVKILPLELNVPKDYKALNVTK